MNVLAQQQQALLGTLLALPGSAQAVDALAALRNRVHSPWARGLAAYQANGHDLAERALRAAYPVVAALVGGDSFATMACELWHRHPPVRGDLACWGDALP
ncbi:HvfC/BufC family peptide modification chaperone, partial [Pseudorhodoferax sp.]|uniref:HvfC/BufC family peptide modification chaperone n=1 Tax=Pseudorhodoferax sp. TaxID=1993553 RepID=UPI002DD6AB11